MKLRRNKKQRFKESLLSWQSYLVAIIKVRWDNKINENICANYL